MSITFEQAKTSLQEFSAMHEVERERKMAGVKEPHNILWFAAGIAVTQSMTLYFDGYIKKVTKIADDVGSLTQGIEKICSIQQEMDTFTKGAESGLAAAKRTALMHEAIVKQIETFDKTFAEITKKADLCRTSFLIALNSLHTHNARDCLQKFEPQFLAHWETWEIALKELMELCLQYFQHGKWKSAQAEIAWQSGWNGCILSGRHYQKNRAQLVKLIGPYQEPEQPKWNAVNHVLDPKLVAVTKTPPVDWLSMALTIVLQPHQFPKGFVQTKKTIEDLTKETHTLKGKIQTHEKQLKLIRQNIFEKMEDSIKGKTLIQIQNDIKSFNQNFFTYVRDYELKLTSLRKWFASANPYTNDPSSTHRNGLISLGFFQPGDIDQHIRSVNQLYDRFQQANEDLSTICKPTKKSQKETIAHFDTLAWMIARKRYPKGFVEGSYFNLWQWAGYSYFLLSPEKLPKEDANE